MDLPLANTPGITYSEYQTYNLALFLASYMWDSSGNWATNYSIVVDHIPYTQYPQL